MDAAVVDREASELARRVAEEFHPEKIILFGSRASGTADDESDIDLLVVMEHGGKPVRQAVAIRRFLNYFGALDLLVRSPGELERRVALGDWFLREVVSDGIVLYDRTHP